jgi:hypothetical protein
MSANYGSYTRLKSVDNAQDSTITNILLDNFVYFYDWGFLDRGSFYNIEIPQSGIYGGDRHTLRRSEDPNYTDGQVWEGYRKNWVWESGIEATTQQPIDISGVFVNSTFYATGNTENPYYIDYRNGRVVFDSAQSTSATVNVAFSHKWVEVVPAEGVPFFREIQQGSFYTKSGFNVYNSGGWAQLGETRIQLPALAIEVNPPQSFDGYQLGGGQWVNNDVVFYIIAENYWECTNIMDIVLYQNDSTLKLFNPTSVALSGTFPFNYRNELNDNAIPSGMYPSMVQNFPYRDCWINNSKGGNVTELSPQLFIGTTRCSTQVKAI